MVGVPTESRADVAVNRRWPWMMRRAPGWRLALLCGAVVSTASPLAAQTLGPASLSFGNVAVGQTSVAKAATLSNTLTTPITIDSISLSGPAAGHVVVNA